MADNISIAWPFAGGRVVRVAGRWSLVAVFTQRLAPLSDVMRKVASRTPVVDLYLWAVYALFHGKYCTVWAPYEVLRSPQNPRKAGQQLGQYLSVLAKHWRPPFHRGPKSYLVSADRADFESYQRKTRAQAKAELNEEIERVRQRGDVLKEIEHLPNFRRQQVERHYMLDHLLPRMRIDPAAALGSTAEAEAQTALVALNAQRAKVAAAAREADALAARVAEGAGVGDAQRIKDVDQVADLSQAVEVAQVADVAQVANVAQVADVAELAACADDTQPAQVDTSPEYDERRRPNGWFATDEESATTARPGHSLAFRVGRDVGRLWNATAAERRIFDAMIARGRDGAMEQSTAEVRESSTNKEKKTMDVRSALGALVSRVGRVQSAETDDAGRRAGTVEAVVRAGDDAGIIQPTRGLFGRRAETTGSPLRKRRMRDRVLARLGVRPREDDTGPDG